MINSSNDNSSNLWLVDRSRYEAGFRCPRLRYLNYHAGSHGKGYQPKEGKLPLLRGIWVHEGLAKVCEVLQQDGEVDDSVIRMAASYAVTGYKKEALERGVLTDISPEHFDFTVKEQLLLVEGLIWAWSISMLPLFKDELEVVSVEQEEHFDLPIGDLKLRFMSKPDLYVRSKTGIFKGQIGIGDWKTKESKVNEWWISQWRDSIQMATGTVAGERRLGEPVSHYYLLGLQVGGRDRFSRRGHDGTPQERQYSHLCYARVHPPNPPMSTTTRLDFSGYWYDKQPLWEQDFPEKPVEMSVGEWVVKKMPKKILDEVFVYAGPYERQDRMIEHLKQEIQGNEESWINKMHDLYEAGGTEEALNRLFPRSYNCHYGRYVCGFYGPCRRNSGWEDFSPRVPHHDPER